MKLLKYYYAGQIADLTGLSIDTIQSWTKRGFIDRTIHKKYTAEQYGQIVLLHYLSRLLGLPKASKVLRDISAYMTLDTLYLKVMKVKENRAELSSIEDEHIRKVVALTVTIMDALELSTII